MNETHVILNLAQLIQLNKWQIYVEFTKLLARSGRCFNILSEARALDATIQKYRKGQLSSDQFIKTLQEKLPGATEEEIKKAWNSMITVKKEKFDEFFKLIKKDNLKFYLVNNTNKLHFEYIKSELERYRMNIDNISIYLSYRLGKFKGEGLVEDVIRDKNLSGNIIYIDPYQPNLDACKKLNIKTYLWKQDGYVWSGDKISDIPNIVEKIFREYSKLEK